MSSSLARHEELATCYKPYLILPLCAVKPAWPGDESKLIFSYTIGLVGSHLVLNERLGVYLRKFCHLCNVVTYGCYESVCYYLQPQETDRYRDRSSSFCSLKLNNNNMRIDCSLSSLSVVHQLSSKPILIQNISHYVQLQVRSFLYWNNV